MVTAVIFDFYGTLAHWADADASYGNVFEAHGYALEPSVADAYFTRYDGVEHAEHSVARSPTRPGSVSRVQPARSVAGCPRSADALVDALRELDQGAMVAYPEAAPTLAACSSRTDRRGLFELGLGARRGISTRSPARPVDAASPRPGPAHANRIRTSTRRPVARSGSDRQVLFVGDSLGAPTCAARGAWA